MRRLLIALISAVSVIALTQMAAAAPPPPVYNWSGFYIGGNVGYSWGNAHTDLTGNGNFPSDNPGSQSGGPLILATPFAFSDSNTAHPNGVIGGGQIGFNYQFSSNWVLGFEADIQGSGERGSGRSADSFLTAICNNEGATGGCVGTVPTNTTALTNYQAKIEWFGTVRGRLGWLVSDQLLVYATGGLAYGKVAVSGSTDISAVVVATGNSFSPATAAFSASKTNVGFSVGAGMEGRLFWLPANWTWKLEYLYLDLGSLDTTVPFALVTPPVGTIFLPATGTTTTHTHFTDNIVRLGVNYKFY